MSDKIILDFTTNSSSLREVGEKLDKTLTKASKAWKDSLAKDTSTAVMSGMRGAMGEGKVGSEWNKLIRAPFQHLEAEAIKAWNAGDKVRAENFRREIRERTKALEKEINARKEAYGEIFGAQKKSLLDQTRALERGADTFRSTVTGGDWVGALRNALEKGGQSLAKRGLAKQGQAERLAMAGGEGSAAAAGQAAKMGQMLSKIGTAAAGFAAIAGAVVMLIKLFIDLEAKVKEANKALLESSSAADFGFSRVQTLSGELRDTLEDIRKDTTDWGGFWAHGAKAKDQQEILSQLNQAGYAWEKIKGHIDDTADSLESYSDVANLVIGQSRVMGLSTAEMAQSMGSFTLETGVGLEDMAMQFSVVTREAAAAGVQTKRFFQTVSEATSGMAFYGVRIEETARILSTLDTMLGEFEGAKALQGLTGQYKGKGGQETLKEFIVKDQAFVREQMERVYDARLAQLERDFGDKLGDQSLDKLIAEASSEADLRKTLTEMGFSGEQRNQVSSLRRLQQAKSGNQAAQLVAAAGAGPGFDLAMQLRTALPLKEFGNDIGAAMDAIVAQNSEAGVIALEQLQSVTGMDRDRALALANETSAAFRALQEAQEGQRTIPEELQKLGYFIDQNTGEIKKAAVGHDGQITDEAKSSAVVIEDQFDILTARAVEDQKTMQEALTKDQEIAMSISDNVRSLSDALEQTVSMILERIYDGVMSIYRFIVRDHPEAAAALQKQEYRDEQIRKMRGDMEAARKQMGDLQKNIALESDPDRKREMEKKLQSLQTQQEVRAKHLQDMMQRDAEVKYKTIEEQAKESSVSEETQDRIDAASKGDSVTALEVWANPVEAARKMVGNRLGAAGRVREEFGEFSDAEHAAAQKRSLELSVDAARKVWDSSGGWDKAMALRSPLRLGGMALDIRNRATEQAYGEAIDEKDRKEELSVAEETAENTADLVKLSKQESQGWWLGDWFGTPKPAGDLVIPSNGGTPIITDSADTLVASRPGGVIEQAMGKGGSGGGPVNVNIYGGDQREIYNTLMRVLRETGYA